MSYYYYQLKQRTQPETTMTTEEIQKRADAVTTGATVEYEGFEIDDDGCFPANKQRVDNFMITVRGMRVALHVFGATDCEPASEYAYRVERFNGHDDVDVGHTRYDSLEEAISALPQ